MKKERDYTFSSERAGRASPGFPLGICPWDREEVMKGV